MKANQYITALKKYKGNRKKSGLYCKTQYCNGAVSVHENNSNVFYIINIDGTVNCYEKGTFNEVSLNNSLEMLKDKDLMLYSWTKIVGHGYITFSNEMSGNFIKKILESVQKMLETPGSVVPVIDIMKGCSEFEFNAHCGLFMRVSTINRFTTENKGRKYYGQQCMSFNTDKHNNNSIHITCILPDADNTSHDSSELKRLVDCCFIEVEEALLHLGYKSNDLSKDIRYCSIYS